MRDDRGHSEVRRDEEFSIFKKKKKKHLKILEKAEALWYC